MKRVTLNLLSKQNPVLGEALNNNAQFNDTDSFVKMFLEKLFSNDITIYEEVEGAKIYVQYDSANGNFIIKNKSLKNDPINFIDLTLQKYYAPVYNYFISMGDSIKKLMGKNWYCFEYFPDEQPSNATYNRMPKNMLVLTGIVKGKKYDYTLDELIEYSELFQCDHTPVIFQGRLSENQIVNIKYFLNVGADDLQFVFGESNFAFFFYKLLNPNLTHSFLMDNNNFQENMKRLVIRIDGNDEYVFEILNPLYKKINTENDATNFIEIYTLILLNFIQFIEGNDIGKIKLRGEYYDVVYCNLICDLFNLYMTNVEEDITQYDFVIPKFFTEEKFSVNTHLIKNKQTKDFINSDKRIEYIFKVVLGSYLYEKKKPIGLFTDSTIKLFNKQVKKIKGTIDNFMNMSDEKELIKNRLLDFEEFYKLNYDTDAAGDIYPNVESELVSNTNSKKKAGMDKFDKSDFNFDFGDYQKKKF